MAKPIFLSFLVPGANFTIAPLPLPFSSAVGGDDDDDDDDDDNDAAIGT
jgi:hypothetical protein